MKKQMKNYEGTLEEIGKDLKITRERVRQIEDIAFRKLRHPARSKNLRAWLDGNGHHPEAQ